MLVFASPAGFEHFALKLGEQARDDTPPVGLAVPGREVLGPVAERYGIEVAGPPPGPANGTIWLLGAGRVTWAVKPSATQRKGSRSAHRRQHARPGEELRQSGGNAHLTHDERRLCSGRVR